MARRVVLVTGGTGDIGKEICLHLARRHQRVAFTYSSNAAAAAQLIADCLAAGIAENDICSFHADFRSAAGIQALVEHVVSRFGRIDVLINNAAVVHDTRDALAATFDDFVSTTAEAMAINATAPMHLSFLVAKRFRKQERLAGLPEEKEAGRIVNVSSRAVHQGDPRAPWYAAAKAATTKFLQSLAKPYASEGIYIFITAPGAVEGSIWQERSTSQELEEMRSSHPLERLGMPEEVARVCGFLALDAPAMMTGSTVDLTQAFYIR
jgi:3-oxoacyl-[acyl-carrier protein] reductase